MHIFSVTITGMLF